MKKASKVTHGFVVRRIVDVDSLELEEPWNVVQDRADDGGRNEDDLKPKPLERVDHRKEPLQGDGEGHQDRSHSSDMRKPVAEKVTLA